MRRLAIAALVVVAAIAGTARPAAAHTVSGVKPVDYESRILRVQPVTAGLTVRILDLGNRVQLVNRSGEEVVVLGYDREPYLRVGPAGTFENRRSPTAFKNRQPSEQGGDAAAAPEWRRVTDEPVARWHDQRTRFEGPKTSSRRHVAGTWTIELQRAGAPVSITGILTFVPGPSALPWVLLAVALAGLVLAAGWTRQWGKWLAVALGLLIASDVMHTIGAAAATREGVGAQAVRILLGGIVSSVAWVIGAVSIPSLQRNHEGGLVAAGGVGLVIAVYGGVTDLGVFVHSQVPSAFPAVTARVAVAVALGLGIGLVGAAIAVIAKDPSLRPTVVAAPGATGTPTRPLR